MTEASKYEDPMECSGIYGRMERLAGDDMGEWNLLGDNRRINKLDMTPTGKKTCNRSLFIFNEGNFIRKSAQTIIEWGYPSNKYKYTFIYHHSHTKFGVFLFILKLGITFVQILIRTSTKLIRI